MNPRKLLKLAPTAVLLAFLGYTGFSLQATMPGVAEREEELAKGLDVLVKDLIAAHAPGGDDPGRTRDPFVPVARPVPEAEVAAREDAPSASDPLAETVAGLSLEATFIQGRDQMAVINGRMYRKGQHLALPDDGKEALPPLTLLFVKQTGVVLRGGGKNYNLGYPDQLGRKPTRDEDAAAAREVGMAELDLTGQSALFQRLLNSPLGAMGRGLIGDAAPPHRPGGSRPGSRPRTNERRPAPTLGP
jgi:hypothetical protein